MLNNKFNIISCERTLQCCVPDCKNRNPFRTFHRLPSKNDQAGEIRKAWETSLGLIGLNLPLDKFDCVVCSGHFNPDDFDAGLTGGKLARMTFLKEVLT